MILAWTNRWGPLAVTSGLTGVSPGCHGPLMGAPNLKHAMTHVHTRRDSTGPRAKYLSILGYGSVFAAKDIFRQSTKLNIYRAPSLDSLNWLLSPSASCKVRGGRVCVTLNLAFPTLQRKSEGIFDINSGLSGGIDAECFNGRSLILSYIFPTCE
jgi:hypothetical protein